MTKTEHRLLLVRPRAQGERFAAQLRERFGDRVQVTLAPLQEIRPVAFSLPDPLPRGMIVTSENGVEICAGTPTLGGMPVWCVGSRTAGRARESGFDVCGCYPDADALVAGLAGTEWPLLLARGTHAKGDIAARLQASGTACAEVIVYDQVDLLLDAGVLDDLLRVDITIVPLFSPRSAALFSAAVAGHLPKLHIAALSEAVLAAYTGPATKRVIAAEPTAAAMLSAIADIFGQAARG